MNKANGFVVMYRKILDWGWYKNSCTKDLFFHLLLVANFVDKYFEGVLIKRGQVATSLPSLSAETGLSIQQVRTALSHLKSTGEITDEANRRYRIITIVKYDDYQISTDQLTDDQQTDNILSTDDQQTINRPSTDYQQQYKKDNNGNKGTRKQRNKNLSPADEERFSVFWKEYPRKMAKQKAILAWKKILPDDELMTKIMDGLAKWNRHESWQKEDGKYVPYPDRWLNEKRWEDELAVHTPDQKPTPVKRVSAQEYSQRDYEGEQEEASKRMLRGTKWGDSA